MKKKESEFNNKMIVVVDFYKMHNEHVPGNASMLYLISDHYSNNGVHFYAEENHCKYVAAFLQKKELNATNIQWHKAKTFSELGNGKFFLFKRIINEFTSIFRLAKQLRHFKNKNIFLLYLSPFTSFFLKVFLWRKSNVLITLHGDLEFITLNNNFFRNLMGRSLRASFKIKRPNCKYHVLEEIIKKNLLSTGLLNEKEIIATAQPSAFKINNYSPIHYERPLNIGYIGIASMEKKAFHLFEFAERFRRDIKEGKVNFVLIGKNENIPTTKTNDLVIGSENKEMLGRSEFEKRIREMQYAIFFHDNIIYQFTSSGPIYDAFNFEKPIIALRTDLFESFFYRAGKVGFLCDDMNEMEIVVRDILKGKVSTVEYETMQANMRSFKAINTLADIGRSFFDQLNEWKN